MNKNIIETILKDEFECECGNTASLDGFYDCDKEGINVEPALSWEGHYKCERCNQIYLDANTKNW